MNRHDAAPPHARVLIEHSPLMSWIYEAFGVTTVQRGLGTMGIAAALLIALRPVWPRALAAGGGATRRHHPIGTTRVQSLTA